MPRPTPTTAWSTLADGARQAASPSRVWAARSGDRGGGAQVPTREGLDADHEHQDHEGRDQAQRGPVELVGQRDVVGVSRTTSGWRTVPGPGSPSWIAGQQEPAQHGCARPAADPRPTKSQREGQRSAASDIRKSHRRTQGRPGRDLVARQRGHALPATAIDPDDRHRHAHHQDVAQHLLPRDAAPAQRRGHQDVQLPRCLSPARVADSAIDHRPVTSGRKPPYLYWSSRSGSRR